MEELLEEDENADAVYVAEKGLCLTITGGSLLFSTSWRKSGEFVCSNLQQAYW